MGGPAGHPGESNQRKSLAVPRSGFVAPSSGGGGVFLYFILVVSHSRSPARPCTTWKRPLKTSPWLWFFSGLRPCVWRGGQGPRAAPLGSCCRQLLHAHGAAPALVPSGCAETGHSSVQERASRLLQSVGRLLEGGGATSLCGGSGHPHHQLHGLLGFVAVGLADDVHGPLVGDILQVLPIHRHQLLPGLATAREGSRMKCRCFWGARGLPAPSGTTGWGYLDACPAPGVRCVPLRTPCTLRTPLRKAAPPGKIFSIFTTGCALDSMPPEMLIPAR